MAETEKLNKLIEIVADLTAALCAHNGNIGLKQTEEIIERLGKIFTPPKET